MGAITCLRGSAPLGDGITHELAPHKSVAGERCGGLKRRGTISMRPLARNDQRGRRLSRTGRGLQLYCPAMRGGETRHHSLGGVLRTIGCQAREKRRHVGLAQRHARGIDLAAKR